MLLLKSYNRDDAIIMPFIPHTDTEIQEMLEEIGVATIEQLYDEIPAAIRNSSLLNLSQGLTELELKQLIAKKLQKDVNGLCFIGAGSYEHHIPAVVSAMISRGEFLTAYTPYQAEASQGNLQLIYEYQTMIASLMGLDVANASVYDGANALTESVLMAIRVNKGPEKTVLIPRTVHPAYRRVVKSIVRQQNIVVHEVDFDIKKGQTTLPQLALQDDKNICALVIPQPNFFGVLEEVDLLTDWAHAKNAIAIGLVNPTAMSLLKEPGQWGKKGVDIACGEGQPLGIPVSSGGPYFGFMACRKQYIRQMPGRIVGRTTDVQGKEGFTLTLQAREQHIRRAKATSNICTNQGLIVTAATVYMSLLGSAGLKQVAKASHYNARNLLEKLMKTNGAKQLFESSFFHEFAVATRASPILIQSKMAEAGIQAGFDLSQDYPELPPSLLICATETKTDEDLERYSRELRYSE